MLLAADYIKLVIQYTIEITTDHNVSYVYEFYDVNQFIIKCKLIFNPFLTDVAATEATVAAWGCQHKTA